MSLHPINVLAYGIDDYADYLCPECCLQTKNSHGVGEATLHSDMYEGQR
jgi:hypothetical protein